MITLIFCGDLKYCPYLSRYTERLKDKREPYEVLFWNRGDFTLNISQEYFYYDSPSAENLNKVYKLIDFLKFRSWIKEHISKSKPDKLIFLSTLTGILLCDLIKKYNHRYIFDIRDYSYENISLFRRAEKKLIDNSFFTAISSEGFTAFLPQHKYIIAHNFNRNELINNIKFIKYQTPLKIVWNGTVRFFDFQKNYIEALKNDERFLMIYHGAGTDLDKYKEYCKINNIKNVVFTGPYDNKDKNKLLQGAAILNNCYGGRDGDQLKYAISNRFYDGLIYHIPQLVEPHGYKASTTKKKAVGISLKADKRLADKLFEYYMNLPPDMFDASCESTLEEIIEEDDEYITNIDSFIDMYV